MAIRELLGVGASIEELLHDDLAAGSKFPEPGVRALDEREPVSEEHIPRSKAVGPARDPAGALVEEASRRDGAQRSDVLRVTQEARELRGRAKHDHLEEGADLLGRSRLLGVVVADRDQS